MGSFISSIGTSTDSSHDTSENVGTLPTREPGCPYHGLPVPAEASTTRNDSRYWYATFFEQAQCVPHRDGNHIIIRWPYLPHVCAYDSGRELTGWPVIKIQNVYHRLVDDHARIVRYKGALSDGSLLIERLRPGPFCSNHSSLKLPAMTVPVSANQDRNDKMILSLYYRWALQDDVAATRLSLALTGFVGADITDDETEYGENGIWHDEEMEFDDEAIHGCAEEDIYFWATFVWRLMTNDFTDKPPSAGTYCWEPCCPVEGGCKPYDENREVFDERFRNKMWQELEEARLGQVLVNAWNRKYLTAEEAAKDVRSFASKMDISVLDDEVELDRSWEDIFEVVQTGPRPHARELRFKGQNYV